MEYQKPMARNVRRLHADRLKRERRSYYRFGYYDRTAISPHEIGKLLHTATPCSCWMCGNPRRYFTDDLPGGLTYQEVVQRNYADSFEDDD